MGSSPTFAAAAILFALAGSVATGGDLSIRAPRPAATARLAEGDDFYGPPLPDDERRWASAALPPASRDDLVETATKPPPDLIADLSLLPEHRLTISLRQQEHAVYLRQREAESFGDLASLTFDARDPTGVVLDWESTDTETLQIARGRLRLSGEGDAMSPRLTMADPPRVVARHDAHRHRCEAHVDARSGVAVVCALDGSAAGLTVGNGSDEDPRKDVLRTSGGPPFVRLWLPARQPVEARLFGYFDGHGSAVVVAAEGSLVPGESDAQLYLGESVRPAVFGRFAGLRVVHRHPLHLRPFKPSVD